MHRASSSCRLPKKIYLADTDMLYTCLLMHARPRAKHLYANLEAIEADNVFAMIGAELACKYGANLHTV